MKSCSALSGDAEGASGLCGECAESSGNLARVYSGRYDVGVGGSVVAVYDEACAADDDFAVGKYVRYGLGVMDDDGSFSCSFLVSGAELCVSE